MQLDRAALPYDTLPFVVPDESPDRYVPIAEAMYTGDKYN
jgi:hypothetical protein